MTRVTILCWAIAIGLIPGSPARCEDSDSLRYHLDLRMQDTNPLTGVHDAWGIGLGANLNRYVGIEVAVDSYELFVEPSGFSKIGEYSVWSIVPQVRLRYPLLRDRLVPYLLVGGGIGFTQFNDRVSTASDLQIDTESSTPVASIGAGIEYFLADNIALGAEVKQLFAGDQTFEIDGTPHGITPNALLAMLTWRLFYPELRPAALAESREKVPTRFYFGVRAGGALPVNDEVFSGIEGNPEPPAYFDTLDQLFGFAVGTNFGRNFGAEISFETYELVLHRPGLGDISELAIYTVLPQLRMRHPLLGGRVVPYALAGVGIGITERNDGRPAGMDLVVDGNDLGIAASLGGGIEYFVTSNIAFNLEARYLFLRCQTLQIDGGPELQSNLDSALFSFGLRIYLGDI